MNERKREALKKLSKVQARNYWNTSGINREFMRSDKDPDPECTPQKDARGRIAKEPINPWWIDSPESGYCFWKWLRERSTPDGKMEPMQQHEIARHLGCSATKIHFIIKEAIRKIKIEGYDEILSEHLGSDPGREQIRPSASEYESDSDE